MTNMQSQSQFMTSHRPTNTNPVKSVTPHCLLIGLVAVLGAFAVQAAAPLTMKFEMKAQKGFFMERCFTLESGQKLSYQFTTRHPVEFNLHHHRTDGQTVFPDKLVVNSQHSKQLVAESPGAYCFGLKNLIAQPGDFDVVVNYQITAP